MLLQHWCFGGSIVFVVETAMLDGIAMQVVVQGMDWSFVDGNFYEMLVTL